VRTALVACAVLVSHALLDTMTDGGLGCALLWPFDLTRYFAPWRPIPVSPIGLDYLTGYGALVFLLELLMFAPLVVFALRTRPLGARGAAILLALWTASLSLLRFSESARDAIAGFVVRDDTVYAAGFSESAFRAVGTGQSERDVRQALGPPLIEYWVYLPPDAAPPSERAAPSEPRCIEVTFENGAAVAMFEREACRARGVHRGATTDEVTRLLGPPLESCPQYTRSPRHGTFRERLICFANGRVRSVVRRWNY
jgi:hypothetical protein